MKNQKRISFLQLEVVKRIKSRRICLQVQALQGLVQIDLQTPQIQQKQIDLEAQLKTDLTHHQTNQKIDLHHLLLAANPLQHSIALETETPTQQPALAVLVKTDLAAQPQTTQPLESTILSCREAAIPSPILSLAVEEENQVSPLEALEEPASIEMKAVPGLEIETTTRTKAQPTDSDQAVQAEDSVAPAISDEATAQATLDLTMTHSKACSAME